MEVILAILAMVVGGLCTFGGAYWGYTLSDRAAQRLRDQETEARRAALLQMLKRQICLLQGLTRVTPGEAARAHVLEVGSLSALLDGQTLSYQRDAPLIETLLNAKTAIGTYNFNTQAQLLLSLVAETPHQAQAIVDLRAELAKGHAMIFQHVLDAIEASERGESYG